MCGEQFWGYCVYGCVCVRARAARVCCCHVTSDECTFMFKSDVWNCSNVVIVIFKKGIFGIILLNLWFNLYTYSTCLDWFCSPLTIWPKRVHLMLDDLKCLCGNITILVSGSKGMLCWNSITCCSGEMLRYVVSNMSHAVQWCDCCSNLMDEKEA
jgi:hypothetical protein